MDTNKTESKKYNRFAYETEGQKKSRLENDKIRKRKKRNEETEEQKKKRLEDQKERQAKRRIRETEEERRRRLEDKREREAQRRIEETVEQKKRRLEVDRNRKKLKRNEEKKGRLVKLNSGDYGCKMDDKKVQSIVKVKEEKEEEVEADNFDYGDPEVILQSIVKEEEVKEEETDEFEADNISDDHKFVDEDVKPPLCVFITSDGKYIEEGPFSSINVQNPLQTNDINPDAEHESGTPKWYSGTANYEEITYGNRA